MADGLVVCHNKPYFFLLVSADIFEVSAFFVVSMLILLVSVIFVVVSGDTADVSLLPEPEPLLLQAAKEAAIIAIAKTFFICWILRIVNNRFDIYTPNRKK